MTEFFTKGPTPSESEKKEIGRLIRAGHALKVTQGERSEVPDVPEPKVLPKRAYKALVEAGYETKTSIEDASDEELLSVKGIGPATLKVIR